MSNPFAGANTVTIPGERNYFAAGDYEVEILSTELRSGHKGMNGIVRCRITKVFRSFPAEGPYAASNQVGEIAAVVCDLNPGPNREFHLGRYVAPIEAAVGQLGEGREKFLSEISKPPGLGLAGTRVRVVGTRAASQGKRTPVVNLSWSPVPEESAVETPATPA